MRRSILGVVLVALIILGIRYHFYIQDVGEPLLEKYTNQNIEAKGFVVSEPDYRETSVRYVVEIQELVQDKGTVIKSDSFSSSPDDIAPGTSVTIKPTNIFASDNSYSKVEYGDLVRIKGQLKVPENFEGDTGREFDYKNYLAKDKIFYELKKAEAEILSSGNGNPIKHVLFRIKKSFVENLEEVISFPESQLAGGIVVAGKKSLPQEIQDEFQKTGTLQIVVLSGYNVTIVADMIMSISKTLSFRLSATCGIIGIILFVIMAGGSATIVRGAIMAILVILAKNVRRRYNVTRALFVTGYVMLLYNPMMLLHDPSFQLSFLATSGLIYVSPIVEKRLQWIPERFKLREITSSTLAAQIAVLPLLMYSTGELSIVSLPANILISLVVPMAMLFCFITGLAGYIGVFLAFPISLFAFVLLRYILQIIHILAEIPYASVSVPYFPSIVVSLVYMSYMVFIWKFYSSKKSETEIQKLTLSK
jgi:competence protein ComEC